MTGSRNYYEVLGVSPSVEDFVLKAVFRALVKKYHPDVYDKSDGAERIREINVAYEVLSDPAKRSAYDNNRGGDQEWSDPSGRHQADLPAEVWVTPDTRLVVPAHVMHDRAVISLVGVNRLCAQNFLANWGRFSSASAAGFEGMQLLTSVAQAAITEIFVNAASLGLLLTPEQLWGLIIEPMLPDAERPLSDLRYAAIGVSEADQRRLTRQTGEFIAAELDRTIVAGVNALLDAAAREGIDIEMPNIIAHRHQSAQSMITATTPQSLARAAASIQTSIYENDAALSIALKHLLSNSGWEDRLAKFVSLVESAGPDHFFDSKTQTGARQGSLCLTEKINSLFKINEEPNIIRGGLRAIEGALPQWWQEAGQHLVAANVGQSFTASCGKIVDAAEIESITARLATASGMRERAVVLASSIEDREQCFRRILSHWISLPTTRSFPPEHAKVPAMLGLGPNEIASAAFATIGGALSDVLQAAEPRQALERLEAIWRLDATLPEPVMATCISREAESTKRWISGHAANAVIDGDPNSLVLIRKASEALQPAITPQLFATSAAEAIDRLLLDGLKEIPSTLLTNISRAWGIDASAIWRTTVENYFVNLFLNDRLQDPGAFLLSAQQLLGAPVDANFVGALYAQLCTLLPFDTGDRPGQIIRTACRILGVADERVTGPRPLEALQILRNIILTGVDSVPGDLVPEDNTVLVDIATQVRKNTRYVSLAGSVAVIPGKSPSTTYILTLNGVATAEGQFYPYNAISGAEAVGGWTQDYVKYRVDGNVFEINKLGSMAVAEFVARILQNGADFSISARPDPTLAAFGGHDPFSEVLLDVWTAPPYLVLLVNKESSLSASLALPRMLTGLAPQLANTPLTGAKVGMSKLDNASLGSIPSHTKGGEPDFLAEILNLCSQFPGKDFAFGKSMDARKLQNARKAFPMPLNLRVFGLVDTTVFGSNETGLAITEGGLYWKNDWTQETRQSKLSWEEFVTVDISQSFSKFKLGEGNFFSTSGCSYPNRQLAGLLRSLQSMCRLVRPSTADLTQPVASVSESPPSNDDVESIITWACNTFSGGGIPVGRDIDSKKLKNAREAFPIPVDARVVGLIDCTVFGNNKVGLALCLDGLVWRNDWTTKSPRNSLSWRELIDVEIGVSKREVMFGNNAIFCLTGSDVKPATVAAVVEAARDKIRAIA